MIDEKLVTKSFLKEFADKCKKIFRPKHADTTTTGVTYAIIDTDLPWEVGYNCEIKLTGTANKSILNAAIAAALAQKDGAIYVTGAVNDLGNALIRSGYIGRNTDENFRIVIEVTNIDALNVDAIFFIEGKSYNVASTITFTDTYEYPEYSTDIIFIRDGELEELNDNEIPIKTATVTAGGVEFTIKNAAGNDCNFPEESNFESILKAGQFANNKTLMLSGDVTGSVQTNFSDSSVTITTELNTDSETLTAKIQNMINNQSASQAIATQTQAGVIKLGNTSESFSGYMPVRYSEEYGAYVAFKGDSGLPYLLQLDSLPSVAGEQKDGSIVQYVGETTDELTNGFIYKAKLGEEEKVLTHTYKVTFIDSSKTFTASEENYTVDTTPLTKLNGVFNDVNQTLTLTKQEDDGSWANDKLTLTAEEFKATFKDFVPTSFDSYVKLNNTVTITLAQLKEKPTTLLTWEQHNVQPEAIILTAGDNINITDNKISALGYTYDADNETFEVSTPIGINNEAFNVNTGTETITITPESKRYNFIEVTKKPEITVGTGDFKGACEIELHILNNGSDEVTPIIKTNDASIKLKKMWEPEAIPAGQCEEIVLTYWKSDYVSYNGGLEIEE